MNFIAVVQNGYIFTNKLAGLSIGDNIYGYDKVGKRVHIDKWEDYPLYVCWRDSDGMMCNYVTQGTGRIKSLYKVVEVYDEDMLLDYLVGKMEHYDFDKWGGRKFAIKVKHIKDLDMELEEFVSWNKYMECGHKFGYPQVKRYNGLMRVGLTND